MRVIVLGGGDSPEREVSLRSATAVANAARQAGFEVIQKDPLDGLDVLDSLGKDDIVLPILHGLGGEDGSIQGELENRKIGFLGSDSKVSASCFDKWITRQILLESDIAMPAGELVNQSNYQASKLFAKPHVLKVLHGGSSIGTLIVKNPSSVDADKVRQIFELENSATIEQLINGTEITVPILDNKALPVIEIIPPPNGEFDYENKYNGRSQELCPPTSVSQQFQDKAQRLAEQVHMAMCCRHLSRVDMMIDQAGNLYVLEINTIPGLTDQSLYPKSAAVSGLPMPELVRSFVKLVERDFRK